ncbi:MAG: phospho-N-acetylmuramoyl-pentapeptide-transferase [Planctomycetes bacterium]|nr:phospho-N-acetylmuramoyl-pentapeptide-transferase [Planctomycetota bacterium]MBM4084497.1 phospho-N-acetylmuramoyl-pentapeptide-transferase [Planctomycetota bacterium]
MLYHIFYPLRDSFIAFNLFRYLTFRAAFAAITAFLICVLFGDKVVAALRRHKIGEHTDKTDSAELAKKMWDKKGTPTMGGILIVGAVIISTLLWANLFNFYIGLALFTTLWLAALGFVDDYIKLTHPGVKGLNARSKLIFQLGLGFILGYLLYFHVRGMSHGTQLVFPFFKSFHPELGVFYILLVTLVIAGTSNAVNLTDGLDGLAIGCTTMASLAFLVIAYLVGRVDFSRYLQVAYVPGAAEMCVFCAALVGASLGFLWFNCYPAQVFMGNTGSLTLGGVLGLIAVVTKQEMMLLFVGGVFIIELLSVIIQVASFKLTGKRVFACAPIHHHFQLKGWPETTVVIRFWIIAAVMTVFSLVTLKLR